MEDIICPSHKRPIVKVPFKIAMEWTLILNQQLTLFHWFLSLFGNRLHIMNWALEEDFTDKLGLICPFEYTFEFSNEWSIREILDVIALVKFAN